MNLIIVSFILAIFCYNNANSALMRERPNPLAEPGQCIPISYKIGVMVKGESRNVPDKDVCLKVSCGSGGSVVYAGCGLIGIPPNCRLAPADLTLPHPGCCKQDIIC